MKDEDYEAIKAEVSMSQVEWDCSHDEAINKMHLFYNTMPDAAGLANLLIKYELERKARSRQDA